MPTLKEAVCELLPKAFNIPFGEWEKIPPLQAKTRPVGLIATGEGKGLQELI
jgi:hypothetical protein